MHHRYPRIYNLVGINLGSSPNVVNHISDLSANMRKVHEKSDQHSTELDQKLIMLVVTNNVSTYQLKSILSYVCLKMRRHLWETNERTDRRVDERMDERRWFLRPTPLAGKKARMLPKAFYVVQRRPIGVEVELPVKTIHLTWINDVYPCVIQIRWIDIMTLLNHYSIYTYPRYVYVCQNACIRKQSV